MLKISTYIHNPSLLLHGVIRRFFEFIEPYLSDEKYLKLIYLYYIGKGLNLKRPRTFNEKLQWLKLYYRNPLYPKLVDKATVKSWVEGIIGIEYIIPTIGVWDRFEDIDFDTLPRSFVLKTTHGGGGDGVVICKDKNTLNIEKAKKKLLRDLKTNIAEYYKEWPYKTVHPRLLAEELISISDGSELLDFKLLCFNGRVKCSFVGSNRFGEGGVHTTYYDRDWNRLPFERSKSAEKSGIPKPENYELMVQLAEKLSKDFPFVRVDLYEANGKVYFGEVTFFPGSGLLAFQPNKWDEIIGSWLTLPERNA